MGKFTKDNSETTCSTVKEGTSTLKTRFMKANGFKTRSKEKEFINIQTENSILANEKITRKQVMGQ